LFKVPFGRVKRAEFPEGRGMFVQAGRASLVQMPVAHDDKPDVAVTPIRMPEKPKASAPVTSTPAPAPASGGLGSAEERAARRARRRACLEAQQSSSGGAD